MPATRVPRGFDVLIEGARVVDGTGRPSFRADVGVTGDRVAALGRLTDVSARVRIPADDLVLAPGFIDVHVHSDARILERAVQLASLSQGVTTHVVGQDGFGFAPAGKRAFRYMEATTSGINGRPVPLATGGVGDYLARMDGATALNVAALVPNGCLRMEVIGSGGRAATEDELAAMTELCDLGLEEGAVGLSSGLDYVPSCHSSTDELVALCRPVATAGAVYVTHVRYVLGLLAALEEAVEVGRRAGVAVHVSHLRADEEYGASTSDVLALVDAARQHHIDLTYDTYPYTFGSSFAPYVLPAWALEGEAEEIVRRLDDAQVRERIRADVAGAAWSWARLVLAGAPRGGHSAYVGLDLEAAAREAGTDPVGLVCDLLVAEDLEAVLIWKPDPSPDAEDGLRAMLLHPGAMLGSDGIYNPGLAHPRGHGAFARFVGRYVGEGLLPLEDAVRRVTSLPARRFSLARRGVVEAGAFADLVLFDPGALTDRGTFDDTCSLAEGVREVWVNGIAVLHDGASTGATPGRGLRRWDHAK
jgi:N-acyl-D-amino-acid deacylase